nr:cytochrome P450 [Tanacetum cinerariifolium]
MFIEFVIHRQFFSYSHEEFAQILDIPGEGACVFTDKWSLDELAYGVPTDGLYQTNPPSPDDVISYIRIDREGQVCRILHEEEIDVHDHQILTREIMPTLKPLEEIIRENVFFWGRERLERIVAREEAGTPLLHPPPSINHPPLILMMMIMRMARDLASMQSSQQWHLFSSAGGTFFTSSENFFWQWERITGSENALSI